MRCTPRSKPRSPGRPGGQLNLQRTIVGLSIFTLCTLPPTVNSQHPAKTGGGNAHAGTIAGHVVSDDVDARPIPRTVVTLRGAIGERTAITAEDGRFEFGGLPAGRFTLLASKAGYVETVYGATTPGGPDTPVAIQDDASVALTIRLPYGAVVAGTIMNGTREPLPGVHVSALRVARAGELKEVTRVETDDRGEYRIFGLAAGDYLLSAMMPVLTPVPDRIAQPSQAEMDALLQLLRQQAVRSATKTAATAAPAVVTFAPVYFPGVWLPHDATPVALQHGEERAGLDFAFDPVPTIVISGSVSGPLRDVTSAQVSLNPVGSVRATSARTTKPATDGTFVFNGIPPGRYRVLARAAGDHATTVSLSTVRTQVKAAADEMRTAGSELLYAAADVEVNGVNVSGVTLVLQPGSTLSGRVQFASNRSVPRRPVQILVTVAPSGLVKVPIAGSGFSLAREARVRADGTFTVSGIAPGPYRLQAVLPPDAIQRGWRIRSANGEGRDLLDADLEFTAGSAISNVVLIVSDARTQISGVLHSATGRSASDYSVVVFSVDPRAWHPLARRTQMVRAANDGTFVVRDLPPGEYFISAIATQDPDELLGAAFFEQIAPRAIRIALGEGEHRVQDLRIVR